VTAGFFVPCGPWCPQHSAATVPAMTMGTRLDPRTLATPAGGWFGLRVGQRGQFGVYLPPVLERLGLAELEHGEHAARVRSI